MEWSWVTWSASGAAVLVSGLIAWAEGNWAPRAGLGMGFVNHWGMWSDLVLLSAANAVIVPHLRPGPWLFWAVAAGTMASLLVHRFWYGDAGPAPPDSVCRTRDGSRNRLAIADDPPAAHSNAAPRGQGVDSSAVDREDTSTSSDDGTTLRRGAGNPAIGRRSGDHMWPARTRGHWMRDLSWSGWAHVVYVAGELALLLGFLAHPAPAAVVLLVAAVFTIHVPIGLLQPRYFLTGHIATVSEQPLLLPCLVALWALTLAKM